VIRKAVILLGVPLAVGLLTAGPVGLVLGSRQWTFAAIAFGLTVPAGLLTLWLGEWLGKTSQYGPVLALFVGTFVRLVVGFGGGVVVFFVAGPDGRNDKLAFWAWILFAYLVTLAIETAVMAKATVPPKREVAP
jgi:hypothetical protein